MQAKPFCEKHQCDKTWRFFEKAGRGWWTCRSCQNERMAKHRAKKRAAKLCAVCSLPVEIGKSKCSTHMEWNRERNVAQNLALKLEVFIAYGGVQCACPCNCNEHYPETLTLEHSGGRKGTETENLFGVALYRYLRIKGYPDKDKLKVFCMNCNFAWGHFGYCPKMKNRAEVNASLALEKI